jgi:hypothetical protein
MTCPLGVLPVSPVAATTVVEGVVDGTESVDGSPLGCSTLGLGCPSTTRCRSSMAAPGHPSRGPDPI